MYFVDIASEFLSIQAQDFIEDRYGKFDTPNGVKIFLSIQAQDFIEDPSPRRRRTSIPLIPEHSSSGLH